ncbi:protein WEAK CHLOROPLAST MOVEMENT UNDER BLUE LIGHT 1-like [Iris pallida]|uniref:Protein WEAK CHLOROPLAST MOVEMENT UNDER BLUE LIGHT 1-like n=1 Tax=Iris pallida TaxID=29817 RepID=A0AAX6FNW4_IRIPA|nr:protein WEAK CHLOROPLAST MOVEMENT UNDER BLUE LIGHT 1-like [Iris pallida]
MEDFKDDGLLSEASSQTTASGPEYLPTCPPPPTPTDIKNIVKEEGTHQSAENGSSLDPKSFLSEAPSHHSLPLNPKMPDLSEKLNETGTIPVTNTTLSAIDENVLSSNTSLYRSSSTTPNCPNVSEIIPEKTVILSSDVHSGPVPHSLESSPLSSEHSNETGIEVETASTVSSELRSIIPCLSLDHGTSISPENVNDPNTDSVSSRTFSPEFLSVPLHPQLKERCSDRIHRDMVIGDDTASDEIGKTEKLADELNHHQGETRSMQNESGKLENSSGHVSQPNINKGLVDTAAPFESVKEAVTKFGGIVDWKAHKAMTMERRKHVQLELENVREEIPNYKKQSEAVEEVKKEVLKELDATKRLIEELKLNLERAQTEESQAKQDSELAQLRIKEIEQGIAEEASIAAKTQIKVAKARHEEAVAELNSVKKELEELRENYLSVLNERDVAVRSADEALSTTKEIEKTVEDLTLELIASRELLESAHAAHLEAEEHRIGAALARDEDCLNWERELKQAKEELHQYSELLLSSKHLKNKLDKESTILLNLKSELAAYMDSRLNQESQSIEKEKGPHKIHQELEEIKTTIEKTKNEVVILRVAALSLKSELEKEKSGLASMRQREGMASVAAASLEGEIERTEEEIYVAVKKEKELRAKMVELPKLLQQVAQEAEQTKSGAKLARDELRKAKEEAEQAKATASTAEIRLLAAFKEIEAAEASEKLALLAVKALQESEGDDFTNGVTVPLVEYYSLSKRAHESEKLANERVISAIAQIEVAKESELKSLERLEEAYKVMMERKETLRAAKENSEKAKEGKLGVEQELRKWRAEHEQRRKASDAAQSGSNPSKSPPRRFGSGQMTSSKDPEIIHPGPNAKVFMVGNKGANNIPEVKRRKKSFFPRILMLLARKKAQSL